MTTAVVIFEDREFKQLMKEHTNRETRRKMKAVVRQLSKQFGSLKEKRELTEGLFDGAWTSQSWDARYKIARALEKEATNLDPESYEHYGPVIVDLERDIQDMGLNATLKKWGKNKGALGDIGKFVGALFPTIPSILAYVPRVFFMMVCVAASFILSGVATLVGVAITIIGLCLMVLGGEDPTLLTGIFGLIVMGAGIVLADTTIKNSEFSGDLYDLKKELKRPFEIFAKKLVNVNEEEIKDVIRQAVAREKGTADAVEQIKVKDVAESLKRPLKEGFFGKAQAQDLMDKFKTDIRLASSRYFSDETKDLAFARDEFLRDVSKLGLVDALKQHGVSSSSLKMGEAFARRALPTVATALIKIPVVAFFTFITMVVSLFDTISSISGWIAILIGVIMSIVGGLMSSGGGILLGVLGLFVLGMGMHISKDNYMDYSTTKDIAYHVHTNFEDMFHVLQKGSISDDDVEKAEMIVRDIAIKKGMDIEAERQATEAFYRHAVRSLIESGKYGGKMASGSKTEHITNDGKGFHFTFRGEEFGGFVEPRGEGMHDVVIVHGSEHKIIRRVTKDDVLDRARGAAAELLDTTDDQMLTELPEGHPEYPVLEEI